MIKDYQISNNFWLHEFLESEQAKEHYISNIPNRWEVHNIEVLVKKVLQPVRDYLDEKIGLKLSIVVSSGFRCEALNTLVGGSDKSFHLGGYAGDISLIIGGVVRNDLLIQAIYQLDVYTELVWEYGDNKQPSWVHVAYNPKDKRKMLKFHGEGLDKKKLRNEITSL